MQVAKVEDVELKGEEEEKLAKVRISLSYCEPCCMRAACSC
jgi:hypothetical protein